MTVNKQKLKDGINSDFADTTTKSSFYDGMRRAYTEILNDIDDGRFNSEINIASLITTIESQKEEIEKLNLIHSDYRRTALERIAYQEQQIEGYKAITELAVNWLKEFSKDNIGPISIELIPSTASAVLDAIERLLHEQT